MGQLQTSESKFIERKSGAPRAAQPSREEGLSGPDWKRAGYESEADWLRHVQEELPKFIPFLVKQCGLKFRGRILEIGAGAAWFSAELSKLPNVVEVVATDFSSKALKEQAPRIFKLLKAQGGKITRTPADFHKLHFPNNHFDYVVCSALLHHGVNVPQVLREARRVLKPGGRLVAIREPVVPLVKLKKRLRAQSPLIAPGAPGAFYSLSDYRDFFARAGLQLEVKRVNFSTGLKYYFDQMVNGLTHARYAFIGTKGGKG